nr:glycosyltransferase [Methylocaldum sp. RMAD-M]
MALPAIPTKVSHAPQTSPHDSSLVSSLGSYLCSLVIPTKNGGVLFSQTVEALSKQTCWNEVEFIVIDSGSRDDTCEIAHSAGAKVIRIPPEEFNHGSTRDYGISIASCEMVILMVQDAVPCDRFLIERLLASLQENGVAGVYARQIAQPTADVLTKRNLSSWLTGRIERETRFITDLKWYESLPPLQKYFYCNFDNVCSGLRKTVWREEPFGHVDFGEDIDWAERVLKKGYKIVYEPAAAVVHSHDRPLSYEYNRTYVCHRKLYRQFRLQLVPSRNTIIRAWIRASLLDMRYVIRTEKRPGTMLKMLFKVPVLNLFSALGQYRAAQDEIRGVVNKVRNV